MAYEGIEEINNMCANEKDKIKENILDTLTKLAKQFDLSLEDLDQLIYPNKDTCRNLTVEEKIDYYIDEHYEVRGF
jgi:hypothetical protein